jgi:hypothetical protein
MAAYRLFFASGAVFLCFSAVKTSVFEDLEQTPHIGQYGCLQRRI